MKNNTKSSITLPPEELKLVIGLQKKLGAKSKVEVIRRGLKLLRDQTDRQSLRNAYREASAKIQKNYSQEMRELDGVTEEGID